MSNTERDLPHDHHSYVIATQRFSDDRLTTIYTIENTDDGKSAQMTAKELFEHDHMLAKFSVSDIRNISYSAIMENENLIEQSLQQAQQKAGTQKDN